MIRQFNRQKRLQVWGRLTGSRGQERLQPRPRSMTALLYLCLLSGMGGLSATAAAAEVVATQTGPVSGFTQDGVTAWLGIPYAAPPIGDLRWKPPQPPATWQRIYSATRFAPSCIQPLRDQGIAYYFGDDPIAEDCLYLNIWRPEGTPPDSKLPVIVYIHGGGFVAGSGRKPLYQGDRLASHGAVVVSINYRLGALGFLAHPALTAESPNHVSGNYGLMDQVAALEWVKANITKFGGDPNRVTLMGQSAGSMSISALQVSPGAEGLFHRIIGMSGSTFSNLTAARTLADAESKGAAFQKKLNAADLAAMRRIPPDAIIAAGMPSSAIIDGLVIPGKPSELYAAGRFSDVPLLLGVVQDEGLGKPITSLTEYRQEFSQRFGENASSAMALYPATDDASAKHAYSRLLHDSGFSSMMRNWAALQTKHGKQPVFAYIFAQKHPYTPGVWFSDLDPLDTGVNHTDEVGYWLGSLDSFNLMRKTRAWTAQDRKLSDDLQSAAVAFAATGSPDTQKISLKWPTYGAGQERVLRIVVPVSIIEWPNADKIEKINSFKQVVPSP